MFGRPRQHSKLGTDRQMRTATIAVWVLGGLFVVLVTWSAIAAFTG